MKTGIINWLGIAFIIETGLLHLYRAPHEYAHVHYLGMLFGLNFFLALVSAWGIFRRKNRLGWELGGLIAAGSIIGYVLSRTSGLPFLEIEAWFDPIGMISLAVEVLFLIVFCIKYFARAAGGADRPSNPDGNRRVLIEGFSMVMVALLLVNTFAYQWDAGAADLDSGQAHSAPAAIVSAQTLVEDYGIELALVAVTAGGGLVDVRYRVIDPLKAARLAEGEGIMPAIVLKESDRTLMSEAHMRTQKLIADRMYFTLIPNTQNAVVRGADVMVSFGEVALDTVLVK